MSKFESLTLALEAWMDRQLGELPDPLQHRVEREFSPMPWDLLSAEQRRTVTLQLDYQHDPSTQEERRIHWDLFVEIGELEERIAVWERVATPTATDLATKEACLETLRCELARLKQKERDLPAVEYYPQPALRVPDDAGNVEPSLPPATYVAYPCAMHHLMGRLQATPEELAAWVWSGPEDGGLAAYVNANELDPPPRFFFPTGTCGVEHDDHDYVSLLMACWFREDEIAAFFPSVRYMTGAMLIERWSSQPGLRPEAFIRAKIAESRLLDAHPIYGGTRGTFPDEEHFPALTLGLFRVSEVEAVEAEDFAFDRSETEPCAGISPSEPHQQDQLLAGVGGGDREVPALSKEPEGESASPSAPASSQEQGPLNASANDIWSPEGRKEIAQVAANARHDKPGGSREKRKSIQALWASGKYASRDICAEQECAGLQMSFATARRALKGEPEPRRD